MSAPVLRPSFGRTMFAALRLSLHMFLADPQWVIPSTIAPVMFALAAFEIYRGSGPLLILYAVLGAGMMSMWGQTIYGSGWAIWQDREFGTLEPTLGSPSSYLGVIGGRVIWNALSGLLGGVIVVLVVGVAYGQPLPFQAPIVFGLLFAFVILSLAAVGLVLASIFVYTRYAGFIQNVGEFAFYIGTGAMFPVILLPFWVTPFSLVFPPTWVIDALRYASIPGYHGFAWGFTGDIVGAVITTALYVGIAASVFRRVERHVLEVGNLDEY